MSRQDPDYNFQAKDYDPSIGNSVDGRRGAATNPTGYHNLSKLRDMLAEAIALANKSIEESEKDLEDYALKITPDSRLALAQEQEWPSDDPKDYVSYAQYKSLEKAQTRGAEYIRKTYEDQLRGGFGTSSIDTIVAAKAVRQEATNITNFLDTFIGEVNDSSEFRTLELLQDWAQDAIRNTKNIRSTFAQGKSRKVQISDAELDQVPEDTIRKHQALFQIKVNAVNKEIKQVEEDLKREHEFTSDIFYNKFLGPALKFRLDVSKGLEDRMGADSFLAAQATGAQSAVNASFVELLADQLNRNEKFNNQINNLTIRMKLRDSYVGYIRQLNDKLETPTATPFSKIQISADEEEMHVTYAAAVEEVLAQTNEFTSAHNLLDGRLEDDAHPQYLLKSGGEMTGNITLGEGVKIDGVVPSEHRHRGPSVDGTEQIHGEDIIDLVTTSIKRDESICTPQNLRHITNQPIVGGNGIVEINSMISWECDPTATFEIQKVPVRVQPASAVTPVSYCVTTLYDTGETIVGIASDYSFVSYATATAVYNYNWETATNTLITGSPGVFADIVGTGLSARFNHITDITQDFYDGRLYIADSQNRKVKMTGAAASTGHVMPTTISTVYSSLYDVRRLDSQGQHFLNTIYLIEGPTGSGKDRVVKLADLDGNDTAAGSYTSTVIEKLSEVYIGLKDIAAASNGTVYLLTSDDKLVTWDPNADSVQSKDISSENAAATAITADHQGGVLITYGEGS